MKKFDLIKEQLHEAKRARVKDFIAKDYLNEVTVVEVIQELIADKCEKVSNECFFDDLAEFIEWCNEPIFAMKTKIYDSLETFNHGFYGYICKTQKTVFIQSGENRALVDNEIVDLCLMGFEYDDFEFLELNKTYEIDDILEETERGIVPVDTYVNEENVEDIYDAYIKFCNEQHVLLEAEYQRKLEEYAIPEGMLEGTVEVTEEYAEMVEEMLKIEEMIDATEQEELPDLDEFDPVFGLKVASTSMLPFISFTQPISEADMESPDYDANDYTSTDESMLAELGSTKGVELGNGDEGDFDPKVDAETRQAAIEAAYTKAYDGTYDRRILTARRIPANAFWDANYPYSVKQTIVNLTLLRKDCIFYMDCGMDYTTFSSENIHRLLNDYSFVDHCLVSKNLQYYTVRESTTSKRVKVTTTYYLAAQYAQHIGNYGPHIPFVKASAELSGHVRDSLTPSIEDYETELKETLYTNRFNYFETLDENVFQRATQSTSQMAETDLIEENNVTVLYDIKRDIERDVQERLYNFADASSRSSFAAYEKAKYSAWVGSRILSIDIQFTANQWESEHSILHCYLAVVFRGLQKRAIVEIDINKRNYETGDATSLENE